MTHGIGQNHFTKLNAKETFRGFNFPHGDIFQLQISVNVKRGVKDSV